MPSLALALLTLFVPALALLAAGLPLGWTALALAAGIAALTTATQVTLIVGASPLFVVPAVAALSGRAAEWLAPGSSGFPLLASALAGGTLLGLLSGAVAGRASDAGGTGVTLLWLAVALALPWPAAPTAPPAVEAVFLALALLVAVSAFVLRLGVGPLAVAGRLVARNPVVAAASAVCATAVGVALGTLAGFAAGIAGFFWSTARALGADPPDVLVTALGLFAAARLAGGSPVGLLAAAFPILVLPQAVRFVLPALPLDWIVAVAATAAATMATIDWARLFRRLRVTDLPAAGRP